MDVRRLDEAGAVGTPGLRLGAPILTAWNAKEDLLDLLASARTHPDRTVIADRLFRFYDRCAASGLPVSTPAPLPAIVTACPLLNTYFSGVLNKTFPGIQLRLLRRKRRPDLIRALV